MGAQAAGSEVYTVQDILDLPDGVRMELIDGFMYDMASPSFTHQRLAGAIYRKFSSYFEKNGAPCRTMIAPFAVFLNDDDLTYLEPDVLVVCDPDKLKEDGCHGAPDLVVEVVSESSRSRDYLTKLMKYMSAGVKEYWIVDPDKNKVVVNNLEDEELAEFSFSENISSLKFENLTVSLDDA